MTKYNKAFAALLAGLAVAVPSLAAAHQDNSISLQEWLTAFGLFLPAVAVALAPANRLDTGEILKQANKDPLINVAPPALDTKRI